MYIIYHPWARCGLLTPGPVSSAPVSPESCENCVESFQETSSSGWHQALGFSVSQRESTRKLPISQGLSSQQFAIQRKGHCISSEYIHSCLNHYRSDLFGFFNKSQTGLEGGLVLKREKSNLVGTGEGTLDKALAVPAQRLESRSPALV